MNTQQSGDKVYVGIPRTIIPLLLGLASAAIIGGFTLMFALFSRVGNIEVDVNSIKSEHISKEEWAIQKYEHRQLMEDRKTLAETNRKLLEWVESQKRNK